MSKDFLLEIGLEEIPARFIRGAIEQLKDQMSAWLQESRLEYKEIQEFATPRRLALYIQGLAEKQPDLEEEVKGPSRKIALTDTGEWSKAAEGFARSQGVDPSALFFKEIKGVEYVYAQKNTSGVSTEKLLQDQLEQLITSLHFPKNMRWGRQELRFVRPIRWLIALYGNAVIPIQIAGVQAGNKTSGHRFLGAETVISSPDQYEVELEKQFVYANIQKRKQWIQSQISELAEQKGWHIAVDEDLLEEVLFLVEYPTVLSGSFNEEFLEVPQDVLITSMREHQRYFPVLDANGKLLPHFVTVRNGNKDHLEQVSRGNEKVLRARLSDARFFYRDDLAQPIEKFQEKLEKVVYHEELGTIGDKVRRIRYISSKLANSIGAEQQKVKKVDRAAEICKFDLVSQMVGEFPELQGVMGEDYARNAGEDPEVARAVFEHYLPRYSGDAVPASEIGAIVSLADKIDSIVGCFSIGIIPTGSQDPYALRRQATGIVQMLLHFGFSLTLNQLFETALDALKAQMQLKRAEQEILHDLYEFFALRVRNLISDAARYDVIDAVMAAGFEDIGQTLRKAETISNSVKQQEAKAQFDAFVRVGNLASKADHAEFNPEDFADQAERELYEQWNGNTSKYAELLENGNEEEALYLLQRLTPLITNYFDQVMVMSEDEKLKQNRLRFLQALSQDFARFADFSKLVWDK